MSRDGAPAFRFWSWWLAAFAAAWLAVYLRCAPDPAGLLARRWMFIPLGFAGAFVGNVSAVGGGIVFIPAMMLLFHLPPVTALKVAIGSQAFGMTSGAIGWHQRRVVPLKALALTVPGLLLGSLVGSLVVRPEPLFIKLLFGPVSILLGVLTLALGGTRRGDRSWDELPRGAALPIAAVSAVGGLLTSWIAIGEGELVAALLMLVYGVEADASIGLGVLLLSVNSIFLALLHSFALGGIPWDIAAFTALGCAFGGRAAAWFSGRVDPAALKKGFAAVAIADGALFIAQSLARR